jgi:DNA end-binding protein Ku
MAPRPNSEGFLRLSPSHLVRPLGHVRYRQVSFNQIDKNTGASNTKVDADTGEEVPNDDITKGFKGSDVTGVSFRSQFLRMI